MQYLNFTIVYTPDLKSLCTYGLLLNYNISIVLYVIVI